MSVCSRTLQKKLKSHLNFNWILKIVFQISDDIVKILEFLMILSKWDKIAHQYCSIHRLVVMTCFRRFWNKINNFLQLSKDSDDLSRFQMISICTQNQQWQRFYIPGEHKTNKKKLKIFTKSSKEVLKCNFFRNPFQNHHFDELFNNFNNTNNKEVQKCNSQSYHVDKLGKASIKKKRFLSGIARIREAPPKKSAVFFNIVQKPFAPPPPFYLNICPILQGVFFNVFWNGYEIYVAPHI